MTKQQSRFCFFYVWNCNFSLHMLQCNLWICLATRNPILCIEWKMTWGVQISKIRIFKWNSFLPNRSPQPKVLVITTQCCTILIYIHVWTWLVLKSLSGFTGFDHVTNHASSLSKWTFYIYIPLFISWVFHHFSILIKSL